MKSVRQVSYEEWLENQGVVGKNENTSVLFNARKLPLINYLFKDKYAAENFYNKHHLREFHKPVITLQDDAVFKDRLSGLYAIKNNVQAHARLLNDYLRDCPAISMEALEKSKAELQAQIKHLPGTPYRKTLLDKINLLSSNRENGWISTNATRAFQFALKNFIILYRPLFSAKELESLNTFSRLISENEEKGVSGILQEDLWQNYFYVAVKLSVNKTNGFDKTAMDAMYTDAIQLVDGATNRLITGVDDMQTNITVALSLLAKPDTEMNKRRVMPRFFPDNNGDSDIDEIYISAGGDAEHRSIIRYFKVAVDIKGNEISDRTNKRSIHHWTYFQTEYNAGKGATMFEHPKLNPATGRSTTGIAWVITTKPINPVITFTTDPEPGTDFYLRKKELRVAYNPLTNLEKYNEVMRHSLIELIFSNRAIKFFKAPNNSTALGTANILWTVYNTRIRSLLGPIIEKKSKKGVPQLSGNCTVMSLAVLSSEKLNNIAHELWRFIKEHNYGETMLKLQQTLANVEVEIALRKKLAETTKQPTLTEGKTRTRLSVSAKEFSPSHLQQTPPSPAAVISPSTAPQPTSKSILSNSSRLYLGKSPTPPTVNVQYNDSDILKNFNVQKISRKNNKDYQLVILSFSDIINALEFSEKLHQELNISSANTSQTGKLAQKIIRDDGKFYTLALSEHEYENMMTQFKKQLSAKPGVPGKR